ncbi:protein adenylyltransferase SelO [Carnimonas nigrificans]|uniref:protein adenylyltransferase SelO n=1 Tax=Carnimonas nigrificans TaxID=64323 RepID=UPI000472B6A6|nr:YdiU family protein [Carnimonas nigrificans]
MTPTPDTTPDLPPKGETPASLKRFDNRFARLPAHFFSALEPAVQPGTQLLDVSPDCRRLLDMSREEISDEHLRALLGGEQLWPGMQPLAQKYTGHQFGSYNPDLGDGRGLLLGEWRNDSGVAFDLHLKGAGRTPYSRHGDGHAVLRSSVREYLVSEAFAGLGLPSTRALAVAVNQQQVPRERWEPGATLLRVAPSHVRFGHFEWLALSGHRQDVALLVNHVLAQHWPDLLEAPSPALAMFERCAERTAEMIAGWQAMGFVHGVMNTDNMSILGIALDFGPFAFQEQFDPAFTPNLTDAGGRYAYSEQPSIGMWNLSRLAFALLEQVAMEVGSEEAAQTVLQHALEEYGERVNHAFGERMRARLGLQQEMPDDTQLLGDFLSLLYHQGLDYHRAFRALASVNEQEPAATPADLGQSAAADGWIERYRMRLLHEERSTRERQQAMNQVNPLYVLRTHLAQRAIEAIEQHNDTRELKRLRELLAAPYTAQPGMDYYAEPAAGGAPVRLSCSS